MLSNVLNLALVALALPLSTLAANHGHLLNRRHADLAKRDIDNVTDSVIVSSRAPGSRWSYYDVQTGNAWVTTALPLFLVFITIPLPVVLVAPATLTVTLCVPCIL